jgi:hypothetical protein
VIADRELAERTYEEVLDGWMHDPYDASITGGLRWNRSEDPKYDDEFVNHPLSRMRKKMTLIQPTIRLAESLATEPSFVYGVGPPQPEEKPGFLRRLFRR